MLQNGLSAQEHSTWTYKLLKLDIVSLCFKLNLNFSMPNETLNKGEKFLLGTLNSLTY